MYLERTTFYIAEGGGRGQGAVGVRVVWRGGGGVPWQQMQKANCARACVRMACWWHRRVVAHVHVCAVRAVGFRPGPGWAVLGRACRQGMVVTVQPMVWSPTPVLRGNGGSVRGCVHATKLPSLLLFMMSLPREGRNAAVLMQATILS